MKHVHTNINDFLTAVYIYILSDVQANTYKIHMHNNIKYNTPYVINAHTYTCE